MPFIEQMLFGVDIKSESPNRSVLAHSPGMGTETMAEIVRLCENWGTPPALGLEHPALMSFRLASEMPSIPGHLFTVIRAGRGLQPLFHAVVLSEGAYVTFQRNPYAVANAVDFLETWTPEIKMPRLEIEFDPARPLVDPAPGKGDIGLVDEMVLKLIAEGKLMMPIEQANRQSDRCLALVIACLPEKERKNLRFASFTTSEAGNFTLAGLSAEGCVFAGWQRMMMAWMAGEYVEEIEDFIGEIRKFLEAGDLAGIARVTQRHKVSSGPRSDNPDKVRRETVSAMPVNRTQSKSIPGPVKPRVTAALGPVAAGRRSPGLTPGRTAMAAPGRIGGGFPEPVPLAPRKPRKLSPLKRTKSMPSTGRSRSSSSGGGFFRAALVVLVLGLTVTAAVMWKEGKTLAESLEWANLQEIMGDSPRTERAATLLEVVDVGSVYRHQLKQVNAAGKGLNPSVDKARHKALGNLREDAASPLRQQVELFAKLAGDGIQQGSRPDRESQRMRSLAGQGQVLANELARLELAWFSLADGVLWEDLSNLSDDAVIVRRDSLARVEKGVLSDARRDLGTLEAKIVLDQTRGNVEGMASLLTLFGTKSWSENWENKLARAAEQVSPTASRMTRAYANSAYAYLSLKRAERKEAQVYLPYVSQLEDQGWPSGEVRSLLTNLRAQMVMFADGQAPELLTATLALYADLKKPAILAANASQSPRVLQDLQANRAVQFDPGAYDDFLERVRYEAVRIHLAESADPTGIPDHLVAGDDRETVTGFLAEMETHHPPAAWDSLSAGAASPFLSRWADHRAQLARVDLARAQQEFDAAWKSCRQVAARLQDEAAAGRDWTRTWLELQEQASAILTTHARDLAQDPERSGKIGDLTNLLVGLNTRLDLGLLAATIRLDQDRMLAGTKATMEIRVAPDGDVWRSDKFYIGPGAPEGAGWVGTVALDKNFSIQPRQGLEIKIISEKMDEVLLMVTCPPLAEGVGPGGMVRPRSGGRGTVRLMIDPGYWQSLHVPDLGMIF